MREGPNTEGMYGVSEKLANVQGVALGKIIFFHRR